MEKKLKREAEEAEKAETIVAEMRSGATPAAGPTASAFKDAETSTSHL
ncbi:hypothetical protein T4B_8468 [Trichinella pseudospiralis]|uniref:Uncharacterized protein n=1 Tax=Trichinella pseudospiralis TaxID=6337 RepID=A0A0V1E3U0_TRIPS|nr:hypothetical protein T4A_6945 [Trichinella pseudospiralis]KRZ25591.1 hypothetical protein T4B_8468 [Trichinella pseudospiralis]KRZ39355.1 hypothetical protein T4C_9792 [Trichinella pseudospiralis]